MKTRILLSIAVCSLFACTSNNHKQPATDNKRQLSTSQIKDSISNHYLKYCSETFKVPEDSLRKVGFKVEVDSVAEVSRKEVLTYVLKQRKKVDSRAWNQPHVAAQAKLNDEINAADSTTKNCFLAELKVSMPNSTAPAAKLKIPFDAKFNPIISQYLKMTEK